MRSPPWWPGCTRCRRRSSSRCAPRRSPRPARRATPGSPRAIGKLRKPTVAAWLVNLLAHERPDLVEELLELAAELRDAQRELRGAELRELSTRRRSTVAALAKEAARLAGPDRGNLPLQEVEGTLAAALADATVAAAVQEGALTKSLEYTGFGETPRPQLRLRPGRRRRAPARAP